MKKTVRAIGQRIKQLRLQRNLTLEKLSNRSGCTAGFLSHIEQNRAVPSVVMLDAIAQALGTRIADFFPETIYTPKSFVTINASRFILKGLQLSTLYSHPSFPMRQLKLL